MPSTPLRLGLKNKDGNGFLNRYISPITPASWRASVTFVMSSNGFWVAFCLSFISYIFGLERAQYFG